MARSTQEIYNEIIAEKNTKVELNELTPVITDAQTYLEDLGTNSRVQDWRVWTWLFSWAASKLERFWDQAKDEIAAVAASAHYGALPWYRPMAFYFQLGHDIEWIDNKFQYAEIDAEARIIKKATAVELTLTSEVVVKVAKEAGVPLSETERTAVQAYFEEMSPPGINVTVVSQDPDDVRVDIDVYYDALVLAADGSLLSDAAVFPVEDALLSYLANIDFDGGKLVKTFMQDSLQDVEGVVNPIVRAVSTRVGAAPFVAIGDEKLPESGHFTIDAGTPLSDQINYIAYA